MNQFSAIDRQTRSAKTASEPCFLRNHVDQYYTERGRDWQKGYHILKGRSPGKDAVLMVSNDYLDLANHPEVRAAQINTLTDTDNTTVMSAVYLHGESAQNEFERCMADWLAMESVLLCQSGYAANVGLIQAIGTPGTPVYIDMMAHASLWQGIQAAGLQAKPFRHNSCSHLKSLIKRNGPGIVVIDSVYSTNGSVAPVKEIVEIAHRAGCVMIVDESHSLGTHGWQGSGIVAGLGLQNKVHFVTASLAKAFAGRAGLIACGERLKEFVQYHSFPAIFSSALLPPDIAGLSKTLELIKNADESRRRLFDNTEYLRYHLDELGYNVAISKAQIIALEPGPENRTITLREALESRGVFGSVFCAPATAANRSLIRFSVNAGLSRADLDHVIDVCRDIREEVDLQNWPSTRRAKREVVKELAA